MLAEETAPIVQETGNRLHLALFGKHPCWTDHMEDHGLATPSLVEFKRRLYYEGISGRIDAGAWRDLPAGHRIDAFDHELLWTGATGVIFARVWHSADAGGRAAYPMVAAAHFLTPRLPARVAPVFSALEGVAADCRAAVRREDVAAAQARGVERLIQAARALVPAAADTWPRAEREEFAAHADLGGGEGFARLFYALTEYQNLHPANRQTFCNRVCDGGAGAEALSLWHPLLRSQLDRAVPLLLCRCRGQDWLDILAGDFPPEEFFRLKAGRAEIPLVTDIPYAVPDDLREQTRMVLESYLENPEVIPRLDCCGSDGPGQSSLGALLGRIFRSGREK